MKRTRRASPNPTPGAWWICWATCGNFVWIGTHPTLTRHLSELAPTDPHGPDSGKEHVVRGGSYRSDAADLRCAARDHTREEDWLLTDPQSPKSIWWYSDCTDVGFRVVREVDAGTQMAVAAKP